MNVIDMPLTSIKPYANNPRRNDKAVGVVMTSIKEFGFKSPIVVDADNVIINGHTRFEAAKRLNLTTVPVVVADDLTDEKVKAFRIMDNKSSEYAEWDEEKLLKEVLDLLQTDIALSLTGFTDEELAADLGITLDEEVEKAKGKKKDKVEGDILFAQELLESHNFVVLYFDNDLDWQVAKEKLGLSTVKWGKAKGNFETRGIGRVIAGSPILERLKDA